MNEKIKSFRDLNIWKKGIEIVEDVYKTTESFSKSELYGLTSQMRRSAVSIPSNIAEGFTRKHSKEYRQFLYIAMGSCAELETHIEIAQRLQYLDARLKEDLLEKINHTTRMIMSLLKLL
ncbi:MAG: four helix bundle protein [Candidatus Omnitrophota bacterium]